MKQGILLMVGLLLLAACFVAIPVSAQTPTPDDTPATESAVGPESNPTPTPIPTPTPVPNDVQALAKDLSGTLLAIVLIAFVAGGLGGLVYELTMLQGSLERVHKLTAAEVTASFEYAQHDYMYDLGSLARIIIGGLAAVAVLFVFKPNSGLELIAVALIAGSAGTAIFRSLQDRLTSVLALKEAADTRAVVADMAAKVEAAAAALEAAGVTGAGEVRVQSGVPSANAAALQEAQRLLAEARGLSEVVRR